VKDAMMLDVTAAAVAVSGLTKRFAGHSVVNDISFSVKKGGTLALLGPSGCGKTTILRCLAGLETPDAGCIAIAGRTAFDAAGGVNLLPEQRGLGVVFQSYAVWPHMTVAQNVGFPLRVRKHMSNDERRERVQNALNAVGLSGLADRSATQISGGQQQRVALARALVHEPDVVLFDEALSNLDKLLREQMRLELKALQDRLGFTAIYVTHDQDEALGLADTLVLLNAGIIHARGAAEDVFRCADSAFSARFFGWNVVPATVVTTGGGAAVRIGGNTLRVADLPGLTADEPVDVGFRREHVALRSVMPEKSAANGALIAKVVTASFQGLHNEYLLDLGDGVLVRALHPDIAAPRGATVELAITPDHVRVWRQEAPQQAKQEAK
jgi:iron(III) transport system ATP-binding protein